MSYLNLIPADEFGVCGSTSDAVANREKSKVGCVSDSRNSYRRKRVANAENGTGRHRVSVNVRVGPWRGRRSSPRVWQRVGSVRRGGTRTVLFGRLAASEKSSSWTTKAAALVASAKSSARPGRHARRLCCASFKREDRAMGARLQKGRCALQHVEPEAARWRQPAHKP